MQLLGKTALVCGSTQGIGLAAAMALADVGANIVLVARDPDRLATTLGRLPRPATAQRHGTMAADFNDSAQARTALDQWLAGGDVVHVLVNNSGGPPGGPIVAATADAFLTAFQSLLVTSHLMSQAVIPGMKAAGYGRIINVVSTSVRQPLKGLGVSNTVRGAVASWAKTLAGELGPYGITVNNVLPGATRTGRLDAVIDNRAQATGHPRERIEAEMLAEIPLGRFAAPEEIAHAIRFLASPDAAYITGVSLPVDGGRISSL